MAELAHLGPWVAMVLHYLHEWPLLSFFHDVKSRLEMLISIKLKKCYLFTLASICILIIFSNWQYMCKSGFDTTSEYLQSVSYFWGILHKYIWFFSYSFVTEASIQGCFQNDFKILPRHTYLAQRTLWSARQFLQVETPPLHLGGVEACDSP